MRYKVGTDKQQMTIMPMCLDDYVPSDHMCRVICAFTKQLDMLDLGFKYAESKAVGNRPYDPRMMLDLYIYGYLHRVRSSRRLEAETHRNVEVMWLMDGLMPDDKTISNFRKDNPQSLREVFRAFNRMCKRLSLFGGELAATDGSKFRADNSRKNNHNRDTVERELSRIEKHISEYLNALEENDAAEEKEERLTPDEIKELLARLAGRKEKFEVLAEQLGTESEISTVDPDARLMHSNGDARKLDVGYNIQTIVDDKHHLIVDFDVTDCSADSGNLQNMSERAMEVMGVETLTNLADTGYYDSADIAACEQNSVTCLVAKPRPGGVKAAEGFALTDFLYDRENDCYTCPCQNILPFKRIKKHVNGKEYRIYANSSACRKCPRKTECTKTKFRELFRLPYQDIIDIVDERTRSNKALYRRRQEIVEHPFGTIKAVWGYKQFLCRTKPKVTAETALACLAYNFRRVINIYCGKVDKLVAAMGV